MRGGDVEDTQHRYPLCIPIKIRLPCKGAKIMINKKYYEKLGGFSCLLSKLRSKLGNEQTDILLNDAVNLCNELCDKYKDLPKKKRCILKR